MPVPAVETDGSSQITPEVSNELAPWGGSVELDQAYQIPLYGEASKSYLTDFTLAANKEIYKLPGAGGSFKLDAGTWTRIPMIGPAAYNMRIWAGVGYFNEKALNLFILPRFYTGWDGGGSGLIIPAGIVGISPQLKGRLGLEVSFGAFYHKFFPKNNTEETSPVETQAEDLVAEEVAPAKRGLVTIATVAPYLNFDDVMLKFAFQWWRIDMDNSEPVHLAIPFVGLARFFK